MEFHALINDNDHALINDNDQKSHESSSDDSFWYCLNNICCAYKNECFPFFVFVASHFLKEKQYNFPILVNQLDYMLYAMRSKIIRKGIVSEEAILHLTSGPERPFYMKFEAFTLKNVDFMA